MEEMVILVDQYDQPIGSEEKHETHRQGLLHRAFSVLLFNDKGETLLQKRAACKYHASQLWANTCCGHPRVEEGSKSAANRRLEEELGIKADLSEITELTYKTPIDSDLTEYEYVHVFHGQYTGEMTLNPLEVSETKWMTLADIKREIDDSSVLYAPWFQIYVNQYFDSVFTRA